MFIIETYKSIEKKTQRNRMFLKRHTYVDKDPQNHARFKCFWWKMTENRTHSKF